MKKIFGELNLTWVKVILLAIFIGIYGGAMELIPALRDTSFTDMDVTFEVWILFGILIIVNSKSALDSALKCFVFFLISQPLIYITQDVINHSNLFETYYRFWVLWTVACIPMGYIGYYMKKDKWWGLLILTPIMLLLTSSLMTYFRYMVYSFPKHLLTVIFCFITLIIYPLYIFKDKKIKTAGLLINILMIIIALTICILKPYTYSTDVLANGDKNPFDDTYKVSLKDEKYGDVKIRYENGIDSYMVHGDFKKEGKTILILESPSKEKVEYNLTIKRDTYDIKRK